jgi:hypothetical protein
VTVGVFICVFLILILGLHIKTHFARVIPSHSDLYRDFLDFHTLFILKMNSYPIYRLPNYFPMFDGKSRNSAANVPKVPVMYRQTMQSYLFITPLYICISSSIIDKSLVLLNRSFRYKIFYLNTTDF